MNKHIRLPVGGKSILRRQVQQQGWSVDGWADSTSAGTNRSNSPIWKHFTLAIEVSPIRLLISSSMVFRACAKVSGSRFNHQLSPFPSMAHAWHRASSKRGFLPSYILLEGETSHIVNKEKTQTNNKEKTQTNTNILL